MILVINKTKMRRATEIKRIVRVGTQNNYNQNKSNRSYNLIKMNDTKIISKKQWGTTP